MASNYTPIRCYSPLIARVDGVDPVTGKKELTILKFKNGPGDYLEPEKNDPFHSYIKLPCGRCSGCRMRYAREWANRLMLENEMHDSSYFVTLTFDDDHLIWPDDPANQPLQTLVNEDTGEFKECLTLNKRHCQLFMKRLRKAHPHDSIRFFCCGEYGGTNGRPHYHFILFGLHLPDEDLHFLKKSKLGDDYYTSDSIGACWKYGFNLVARVTWKSCCYVARYVMKKYTGPEGHVYSDNGLLPPFTLMSRDPGIAKRWFEAHPDKWRDSIITLSELDGARQFPQPSYFKKMFAGMFPEEAREMQNKAMEVVKNRELAELHRTNKEPTAYNEVLERNFLKAQDVLTKFRQFDTI